MPHTTRRALLSAAAAAPFAMPARAHHSFAMYDPSQPRTLNGTVREFQWTAPHVMIWFFNDRPDGTPGSAESDLWTVELSTSPGPLGRLGWSRRSLAPGDRIEISINPLRSGEQGGQFRQLRKIATGEVLTTAAPTSPQAEPSTVQPARP